MPQEIWFLRHGDAVPHGSAPDAERALTDRGRDQARTAGAALARLDVTFDEILASPRVRARDTAALAARALGAEPRIHEPLSGGFSASQALDLLVGRGADARVLLVGHEPDFSRCVHDLTGARVQMKKGGIAAVRCERSRGELLALLAPRQLRAIAG